MYSYSVLSCYELRFKVLTIVRVYREFHVTFTLSTVTFHQSKPVSVSLGLAFGLGEGPPG
jgi:hypothetical protein